MILSCLYLSLDFEWLLTKAITHILPVNNNMMTKARDHRGHDHMVVGFTTNYTVSAYHH